MEAVAFNAAHQDLGLEGGPLLMKPYKVVGVSGSALLRGCVGMGGVESVVGVVSNGYTLRLL